MIMIAFCFPVWNMHSSGFLVAPVQVSWLLTDSVGFCICSISTEFLGNSKQGLYFCCKVQEAFAIFLEALLKLVSDQFQNNKMKWKRNESTPNFSGKN